MQLATDPRHLLRQKRMQLLFEWDFQQQPMADEYMQQIIAKIPEIDEFIKKNATMWKIEDMARVDVAILRLSIYELIFEKQVPKKTVIDEAVELAKEFGNEKSPGFINGTLDRIYASQIQEPTT